MGSEGVRHKTQTADEVGEVEEEKAVCYLQSIYNVDVLLTGY